MELKSSKLKLSEITIHYGTSLTGIQLTLSNGIKSPVLTNCTESDLNSQKQKTFKLDNSEVIDGATLHYSPVYSSISGFVLSNKGYKMSVTIDKSTPHMSN